MAAALGLAASVIAVLQLTGATISACYNYRSGVKNASRDKARIIDQLFGLQKALENVRRLVEDDETAASSRLPALNEQLLRCGAELQSLNTKLESDLRRKGRMQAFKWPLKESEVHKTLDKLGELQELLTTAMDVDQTRLTLKIDSGVESLQEQTAEIMEQAKLQEHRQEIQKLYQWLAAPDHWSKHRNARDLRQAMTGSWFMEGKHFQEWREAPHSFLWLHGIPGAGKTILCSTIVEELSRHCRSDPYLAMAFFYFDFNNKDTPPDAVLRSLIVQLSAQWASTPHALESLFSEKGQGGAPGQEDLMSTLKTIISGFQAVYIVFDALDECPERSRFLTVIGDIHGWEFGLLHLLATSRKERDIEEALSGLISQEVPMDENLVDGDIQVHVSRTLENDIKLRKCSADEKEMAMTTLIAGAHGMFRWVGCQLDALRKCRTPAAFEEALTHLPKTLNQTYDRILAAIDEDDRRDALSLLQWLAFSVGMISTDEAVEVLATNPDARQGPLFDRHRRLRDPGDILTICSSLVTIEGGNAKDDDYKDSNNEGSIDHHGNGVLFTEARKIRLAHLSVREYLTSEYLHTSTTVLSCYYFNEKIAHVFIAKTCLAYLLQFDQDNGVNSNTSQSYPLSHYAASNWLDHAGWDQAGNSDDLHGLITTLLEPMSAVYKNWMWLYHQSKPWEHLGINALYIAAEKGLEQACQHLLQMGLDVNAPRGYYGTPLQAAALRGHDVIVWLLIEKGADVNAQGGEYGNALQAAVLWGDDTTVQLLLENGADVNAQGEYRSALQEAALQGHDKIARLLLEKGADVNAQGGEYRSALQEAVLQGHDMIARLLLETSVDMDAQGGEIGSALQVAAFEGHDTIVQLLIENGANINAQEGDYGSALQAAVLRGHDGLVRLLLEKGADVNAQGGCYRSALQVAVLGIDHTIVRLLLEKGADTNWLERRYQGALHVAALRGDDTIVQLLIEKGADVNVPEGEYGPGTVLQAAAAGGHDTTVQLLLEKGADVNAQGGVYGSAMQTAILQGHDTIVRLLLEKGADMNEQGVHYQGALQTAAAEGHDTTVQLLLEKGMDVNAQGEHYQGALQAAAAKGHDTIVQLLLEKGTDVNAQRRGYGSALQAAVLWGHDRVVRLLLEKGADMNAQGGVYGSVLQTALSQGHDTTVLLLIEKGADVNAQGGEFGSALQAAALEGQDMIVQLLLEKGADVNAQGGTYGSALQAAVAQGHNTTVWLLIEKGADVNAKGGEFGSALQAAAFQGHNTIVQLLIEKGADVNAQGGVYGDALQAAAMNGHNVIASLLLERAAVVPNVSPEVKWGSGWAATFSKQVPQRQVDLDLKHTLEDEDDLGRPVTSVCFSTNGHYLAAGCFSSVQIYNTTTGERMCVLVHRGTVLAHINSVCFSPDGTLLAATSYDGNIRIWDIATRCILSIFKGHEYGVSSLDFSRDGHLIISGCSDNIVRIWNMETGHHSTLSITAPVDPSVSVFSVSTSPDGALVAAGYDAIIHLWNLQTGQLVKCLMGHTDCVLSVVFTPNGKSLVSGGLDGSLKYWDLELLLSNVQRGALGQSYEVGVEDMGSAAENSGQNDGVCVCMVDFMGHTDAVHSIAVSQDNHWLVSGSDDRSVRVWDLRTGEVELILHGHKYELLSAALSPTGDMLATSSGGDGHMKLWSFTTLQ